ncbi:cleft lip and palate transmembrane 1 [Atractiella rhizophila]|nr:cleft lip and palate transmembrane 1 [Atractiella rhizophila]
MSANGQARRGGNGDGENESFFKTLVKQLPLMIGIWMLTNFLTKQFLPQSSPQSSSPDVANSPNSPGDPSALTPQGKPKFEVFPAWPLGTELDLFLDLRTGEGQKVHMDGEWVKGADEGKIKFGEWGWERTWEGSWKVPKSVQHNSSLSVDIYLVRNGIPLHTTPTGAPAWQPSDVSFRQKLLTRFHPLKRERKTHNLLSGTEKEEEMEEEPQGPPPIISYYHPNLTLALVSEANVLDLYSLPAILSRHVSVVPAPEGTQRKEYYPIVFPNDFWLMKGAMEPINETISELPLRITVHPTSWFKFQMYASFQESFDRQAEQSSSGTSELDEIKRMLIETNPLLLGTTIVVSILHSLFEFLAFKNDIVHWRNKKELVGVSVRTIITNVVVQLIILLYLVDNNENTSWMILAGQGFGLVIEAWKITKAVSIKVVPSPPGSVLPWKLDIQDRHVLSEEEKKTQEYDALAFKYVSWVAGPALVGYTIYSLIAESHRGWYSFIISTLTSYVYAFGFVQLIPQLIINYKLKSVAHMPMRTFTYKFLNTIVDDFFSFVIKMPLLHRLACFRDDIVFLILIYQSFIYKVDYTRANEFGQVGEGSKEAMESKDEKGESKKDR